MCTLFISRDIENSVKGHTLENDAAGVLEALGRFRFSLTEIRLPHLDSSFWRQQAQHRTVLSPTVT